MKKIKIPKEKNFMKGIFSFLLVTTLIISNTFPVFASSLESDNSEENYEISDLSSLKEQIQEDLDGQKVTNAEKKEILANTDPEVIEEFVEEKEEKMEEALASTPEVEMKTYADGTSVGTDKVDLGDGCYIETTYIDEEDLSVPEKIGAAVSDLFVTEVHAATVATDSRTVTKAYGNRKYTSKTGYFLLFGYGSLKIVNHYKLSSSGITERYGEREVKYGSTGDSSLSMDVPVIVNTSAKTSGSTAYMSSTVHIKHDLSIAGIGFKGSTTMKYKSKLVLKSINKSDKTVTLVQKGVCED